ncbi:glycosyltransferase [uncultured Friedmanniella sp.]|uniref:glycosyltransferase n=1 Tax=uncultured Friedmanniella sp. TaxID=335381 RepID=UPI0035CBE144
MYSPFSFNGQGPGESCAEIVAGFPPQLMSTHLYGARFRRRLPAHVELHPSLPLTHTHVPWSLVAERAEKQLVLDFRRALGTADPRNSVAYFWPDPPVALVQAARERGIPTVREMINTARAYSGPILDGAYGRLGLGPTDAAEPEKVVAETEELRLYDRYFASNPEVEKSLVGLGVRPEQILSTTFGWTPSKLTPPHHVRVAPCLRFLFVGSVSVRKGVPELLEAWSRAGVDGELVLAGRIAPELRSMVAAHERKGSVQAIGFRRDVAALFHSADVFVFPTLEEGGPQVTYEAAGCGLPVITTPMGAARLIESERNGLVVEPGSVAQLADAISSLAGQPELRTEYGAEARRGAQRFAYEVVAADRCRQLVGVSRSHVHGPG